MMKTIQHILVFLLVLLSTTLMSQTYVAVGGELTSDMVLRKLGGDSIYMVNSTLHVVAGRELRVEPGTRAAFRQDVGISVDHGSLIIEGDDDDSISFFRYDLSKDWAGIYVKNITEQESVSLRNLVVEGASQGLFVEASVGVVAEKCTFRNNFSGTGVSLVNASNNKIVSSLFKCSKGVEITSTTSVSVSNIIKDNIFDGGQIGVYILSRSPYMSYGNMIDNNCIVGAATALYCENIGSLTMKNRKNYIRHNVISSKVYSSQYSSYGLKTSMDSLVVEDNIFWDNEEAFCMMSPVDVALTRNTFYCNNLSLRLVSGNGNVMMKDNVFSETFSSAVKLVDVNILFRDNNILHYDPELVVFENASQRPVDMSDNYWDTDEEQVVEHVLYDYHEDPTLGKVFYMPMLTECNDNAPLSPPYNVRKQAVETGVLVSWDSNPEEYVDHYKLYYGGYQYYTFSNLVDTLRVTSVILEDVSLTDVFAVQACRVGGDDTLLYSSPSRSAFAFAQAIPYAGGDFFFCREKGLIEFVNATIPPGSHHIEWETDGSGVFINFTSLHPLYFPSDNDYENGELTFNLCATCDGVRVCDVIKVQLGRIPEVDLGDNYYSGHRQPIVLEEAEARFYDSICWVSSGDGHFEDSSQLKAVYYPGKNDIEQGSVCLYLYATSQCGMECDTVCYDIFEEYSLHGNVWADGYTSPYAHVIAVNVDDNPNPYTKGFYRTRANGIGMFSFPNLTRGNYVLYAIPDDISNGITGAYYIGKTVWEDGVVINVDGDVYDVDISLPTLSDVLPIGEGEINGYFEHPGSRLEALTFYCSAWSEEQQMLSLCDGGLSNISIFLTNPSGNHIFGFVLTDENGRFRLSGLPYGEYRLNAEIPRYKQGANEVLTITPESPVIDDVVFYVDDDDKVSLKGAHHPNVDKATLELQPNPVEDSFLITGLEPDNDYVISIHNVLGVFVLRDVHLRSDAKGTALVDVHLFPEGLYLLKVSDASSSEVIRFYKK